MSGRKPPQPWCPENESSEPRTVRVLRPRQKVVRILEKDRKSMECAFVKTVERQPKKRMTKKIRQDSSRKPRDTQGKRRKPDSEVETPSPKRRKKSGKKKVKSVERRSMDVDE